MQIFIYAKTQIACLVILLYMAYLYIVEGCYLNKIRRYNDCNFIYDFLFTIGELALVFDGVTAVTVNYVTKIPLEVNLILHLLFFFSVQAFISTFAFYTFSFTGNSLLKKSKKILFFWPLFFSVPATIIFLPQLKFVEGKVTNYSDGISAFITFVIIFLYGFVSLLHFLRNLSSLPRRRKTAFISWILVSIALFIIQVFYRETLVSSIGITMILLAAYECIETPTLKSLELTHNEMIMGFATLVESKDGSTGGHINRTSNYVALLTEALKNMKRYHKVFTNDYISFLKRAAPMHDIGKIAIPDEILKKPSKLSDDEFEIMKSHTVKGGKIIEETFGRIDDAEYKQIAYNVAMFHHEKWDGTGYPTGLKKDAIPLEARIMAVADVFDAVSTNRCYRQALDLDTCFNIIKDGRGKSFDPLITDIFLEHREQIEEIYFLMVE